MSRPGLPTPNTAPNPTTPEHPVLRRVGGLALTALGGYAMHKGFHADFLGNPSETMGTPAGEVIKTTVIASTLALTGLRTYVTDARLGIARRSGDKAEKNETRAERSAKLTQDSYTRIMEGTSVPYDTEITDRGDPTIADKATTVLRKVLHPGRKPKPTDNITANRSWGHERSVRKMVSARNKKKKLQNDEENKHRWMGNSTHLPKPETDKAEIDRISSAIDFKIEVSSRGLSEQEKQANIREIYNQPDTMKSMARIGMLRAGLRHQSDLGTDIGWTRHMQTARTGREVRGYRNAVDAAEHELHKAHDITKKLKDRYVDGAEFDIQTHTRRKERLRRKIGELEDKKTRIASRQDIPGRIYDASKRKIKSGASKAGKVSGKAVKASSRGVRTGGRVAKIGLEKRVDAIRTAPDAFRDASGGAGNSGRVQHRINSLARNLGERHGRRKASTS